MFRHAGRTAMEADAELDDAVAALLLPLDELDDLALDETLVLDEEALLAASSPPEQPTDDTPFESTCRDGNDTSAAITNTHTSKKKKKKRPSEYDSNSARNKRRHELAYLRRRVEEMQQELVRAETFGSIAATADARQRVWKEIASRQFNERQRAESENQLLKAALETHIQVARSLEAILTKRSTAKAMEDCGLGRYVHALRNHTADGSDAALFAGLLKSVDEIHTDAEWLIRQGKDSGFDNTLTPNHNARMRPTDHGLLVEIFGTDLLPFSLSATSEAAWQYFSHGKNHLSDPIRHYYERVGASDENTVFERSGFEMTGKGSKITVNLKQVLRRYVEADRVVIAWSAAMEPVAFAGKPLGHRFSLRQWGCMVLRASTPTDGAAPLTVLQSCFFMTPEFLSGGDSEKSVRSDEDTTDTGKFTECVLSWVAANLVAWRQRIENILMDTHLGGALLDPPAVRTGAV